MNTRAWLTVEARDAPLIVSIPHAGTDIPAKLQAQLTSTWLARKDTDWFVVELYAFAASLGATLVHTSMSRSVIDVNRDPSGASLYPGLAVTGLCPATTFDGEPLYPADGGPDETTIAARRRHWFDPYHDALAAQIARLRAHHPCVVLYDAHSIRSRVPRLFEGELPHLNLGTNSGRSCAPALADSLLAACAAGPFSRVCDGRFKGGWITRRYGQPEQGVHAVQMELACRGYLREPDSAYESPGWPPIWQPDLAAPLQAVLRKVLEACLAFARHGVTT